MIATEASDYSDFATGCTPTISPSKTVTSSSKARQTWRSKS